MKIIKIAILIQIITLCVSNFAHSKDNLAFINLDEVIKNSNYGKLILNCGLDNIYICFDTYICMLL